MHALVTGGAGFIGSHVVDRMLRIGWRVTVIDNMDPFYHRSVKESNIAGHAAAPNYRFMEGDVLDPLVLSSAWNVMEPFDAVLHLAAKAGVRPSISDPIGYDKVNVRGTLAMLDFARERGIGHFILASSSSVYGEEPSVPWKESVDTARPISPYAASKVIAERLAGLYSKLHGMRVTALRFFTVYGPRQRPDLAIHRFTRAILEGTAIEQFGDGSTRRDYTFIDDIVDGIIAAIMRNAGGNYEVYNLGNSRTVALRELISALEEVLGKEAIIKRSPEQPGDVPQTFADTWKSGQDLGYEPRTELKHGLMRFKEWYQGTRLPVSGASTAPTANRN